MDRAIHICGPIEVNRRRTQFSDGILEQRGKAVDCCRGPSGCSVADGRRGAGRRVLHLPRKEQVHSPQVPSNPQGMSRYRRDAAQSAAVQSLLVSDKNSCKFVGQNFKGLIRISAQGRLVKCQDPRMLQC